MQTPMMNPGLMMPVQMDGFAKAFEAGQQRQREEAQRNALAALAMNPSDPQAQASAARFAPQAVMQARQQEAEAATKQVEAYRDTISKGAEMLQRLTSQGVPKQQAAQMVRQTLIANRFPGADQIPEQMDDQYIDGVIALAKPDSGGPTSFQEYQRAQSDPNFAKFLEGRRGPLIANNGDGTFTIIPRPTISGGGGGLPRVTDAAGYNAIPPGAQYMDPEGNVRTKGGQSGAGSAGEFRP